MSSDNGHSGKAGGTRTEKVNIGKEECHFPKSASDEHMTPARLQMSRPKRLCHWGMAHPS